MRKRWTTSFSASYEIIQGTDTNLPFLKSLSSIFSLTANILLGFTNHFIFFLCSQIHVKILPPRPILVFGVCPKFSNQDLLGCKHNVCVIPWIIKKDRHLWIPSLLESTQFLRSNSSKSNTVKDTQNENAREQPKRLLHISLREYSAQEKYKTI